jgi:hypothetical protein
MLCENRAVKFPGCGAGDFYFRAYFSRKYPKIKNVGKALKYCIPVIYNILLVYIV